MLSISRHRPGRGRRERYPEGCQAVMITAATRDVKDPTNAVLTHTIRACSSAWTRRKDRLRPGCGAHQADRCD
jgi:hypothetical protein